MAEFSTDSSVVSPNTSPHGIPTIFRSMHTVVVQASFVCVSVPAAGRHVTTVICDQKARRTQPNLRKVKCCDHR